MPKSTFYHKAKHNDPEKIIKLGPIPVMSDEELLKEIKGRIGNSLFIGEGHREIWAFLKYRRSLRVSRRRVHYEG